MQKSDIIRMILFTLFFSIGASALGLSVLCEDLIQYYSNIQLTETAQESLEKLDSLNEDYDVILKNVQEDPNYIKRIARAAVGAQYQDANAVYPKTTPRQLEAARRALTDPNEEATEPVIPKWLSRSSEPRKRMILFFSGVILILISSVCFRPVKNAY